MEHIVQEGINTKKNSNLKAFLRLNENVIKTRKKREILSNKPLRQMCGHGC